MYSKNSLFFRKYRGTPAFSIVFWRFFIFANLGFCSFSCSRERKRRVLVVCVNCRGKVAPSPRVRSGWITFAYSHFGVAPVRSPRRESLCYGQISGCRGSNRKIFCGITGLYYGGINGRFCGSCWTGKRSREKSLIWQEGNQFSRRITRM